MSEGPVSPGSIGMGGSLAGHWSRFADLGPHDVHDLLMLRQAAFVIEQDCLYPDIDGKDPFALHFLVRDTNTGALAGAIRLFQPDAKMAEARIGRVVVGQAYRGTGLGRRLMIAGIDHVRSLSPDCSILLSAQAHLEDFYNSLGFCPESAVYLEDGIPHIDMALRPENQR